MTEYEIAHGLSQDAPGPLEPVEVAKVPESLGTEWKLVPVEPTDEMEVAAENDYEQTGATFPRWKSAYAAMLKAAPPAPTSHPIPTGATGEDGEAQRDAVMDAIAEALGDAYDCTRVWSAWGVGTMSQDDFCLVTDDAGRLGELADAAIDAMRPAPAAGDALDALRELVACDNIKKQIASMQVCVLETDDDVQELDGLMSDLARRQPAAWEAARAAIAQQKGEA